MCLNDNGRRTLLRRPFPETPGFSLPVQLETELNLARDARDLVRQFIGE
jgi:hypothetical protein